MSECEATDSRASFNTRVNTLLAAQGACAALAAGAVEDALPERLPPRDGEPGCGPLVVCGHIHHSLGYDEKIGPTRVVNAGPKGVVVGLW